MLFSPCDLCGGRDSPPNVKPVWFERADSFSVPDTYKMLHICWRCEKERTHLQNGTTWKTWAMPCAECGLHCCTQEDVYPTWYSGIEPLTPGFRCESCKPKANED